MFQIYMYGWAFKSKFTMYCRCVCPGMRGTIINKLWFLGRVYCQILMEKRMGAVGKLRNCIPFMCPLSYEILIKLLFRIFIANVSDDMVADYKGKVYQKGLIIKQSVVLYRYAVCVIPCGINAMNKKIYIWVIFRMCSQFMLSTRKKKNC